LLFVKISKLNDNELRTLAIKLHGVPVLQKNLDDLTNSLRKNGTAIDYFALTSNADVMGKLEKHYNGKAKNKY